MAYFSARATERTRAIKRDAVFIEFAYERDYCEEKIRIEFHRFDVSIIRRVTTITVGECHYMDYGTLPPTACKQYRNYAIRQKRCNALIMVTLTETNRSTSDLHEQGFIPFLQRRMPFLLLLHPLLRVLQSHRQHYP